MCPKLIPIPPPVVPSPSPLCAQCVPYCGLIDMPIPMPIPIDPEPGNWWCVFNNDPMPVRDMGIPVCEYE